MKHLVSKHLVSFLEGFAVTALAQAPALARSHAVQDFVASHPADAVLVPVAVGLANVAYKWLKARHAPKPTPATAVPFVGPVATTTANPAVVTVSPTAPVVAPPEGPPAA